MPQQMLKTSIKPNLTTMKNSIAALAALLHCFCAPIGAQKNADTNWVGGFKEYPQMAGYSNYVVRFQPEGVSVDTLDLGLQIESTSASISDSSGQLLFFSNGCSIADANGQIFDNGDGLNPGPMHDWVCGKAGYVVQKGALILPLPEATDRYYLFHLGAAYETPTVLSLGPLYYTIVDGASKKVLSKNNVLLEGKLEPFSVVRHGNGRDWWVLVPEWGTGKVITFLFGADGIAATGAQETGIPIGGKRVGATAFSTSGDKYARYHADRGVFIADFDRCSGLLEGGRMVPVPFPLLLGGGVAFSPNGQKLYVTSQSVVYEIDADTPKPSWDTLLYLFDNYNWGTTLHHMQYGPNGILYINTHSRADYLNAISFNGAVPFFKFKSLNLGVKNARTLPHFPNFRLYDLPDSPCDTLGINTPVSTAEPIAAAKPERLVLFPNPASDQLQIGIPESWSGPLQVMVLNTAGQVLLTENKEAANGSVSLNLRPLPAGMYVCRVMTEGRIPLAKMFAIIR